MKTISLDFETYAMSIETGPTPKPVVLARSANGEPATLHIGQDMIDTFRRDLLSAKDGEVIICGQNWMYDLGCAAAHFPDVFDAIFHSLDSDATYDTMIAEKLMNLQEFGVITQGICKGIPLNFKYGLDALAEAYGALPEGYSEMKHGGDAWRLKYGTLEGIPLKMWPQEAIDYPKLDVTVAYTVMCAQLQRATKIANRDGVFPLQSLGFRMRAAFGLRMTGAYGISVDIEKREEARVAATAISDKADIELIKHGIVVPAVPAMPYKRGGINPDGSLKMKAPEKAKVSKDALQKVILSMVQEGLKKGHAADMSTVEQELEDAGIDIEDLDEETEAKPVVRIPLSVKDIILTPAAKKDVDFKAAWNKFGPYEALNQFPEYIATSKKFMNAHSHKHELTAEFALRQGVQKILTTALPCITPEIPREAKKDAKKKPVVYTPEQIAKWRQNPIVWAEYDPLKETGRSSSYASSLFPSLNAQQIPAVMRGAFRSHGPDRVLGSQDFSGMELGSSAQVFLDLFGESVMATILNEGEDIHGYTGAQFAYSESALFRAHVDTYITANHRHARGQTFDKYMAFKQWKKAKEDSEELKAYKHFRKLAKPFNLGLIGGLGIKTFAVLASTAYDVHLTDAEIKGFIDMWHSLFPEVRKYFDWIKKSCRDYANETTGVVDSVELDDDTGKWVTVRTQKTFTKFKYTSPSGMVRANCNYCAAANGKAMQGTSADGALTALYEVIREISYDRFYGAVPYAFVHDEIILDCPEDKVDEAMNKLSGIMVREFRKITPDVKIKTEHGCMRHWSKAASDTRFADGTIMLYEEKLAGLKENPRIKK